LHVFLIIHFFQMSEDRRQMTDVIKIKSRNF
jgi:hypothetical protein